MIIFLLDHYKNVFIVFFYTCRSAQLNMNGRMREPERIKCLILKMRIRLPTICFTHSVTKGYKTYATEKLNSSLASGYSPEEDYLRDTCTLFLKPFLLTSCSDLDHLLSSLHLALDWRSRFIHAT